VLVQQIVVVRIPHRTHCLSLLPSSHLPGSVRLLALVLQRRHRHLAQQLAFFHHLVAAARELAGAVEPPQATASQVYSSCLATAATADVDWQQITTAADTYATVCV